MGKRDFVAVYTDSGCVLGCDHKHQNVTTATACIARRLCRGRPKAKIPSFERTGGSRVSAVNVRPRWSARTGSGRRAAPAKKAEPARI